VAGSTDAGPATSSPLTDARHRILSDYPSTKLPYRAAPHQLADKAASPGKWHDAPRNRHIPPDGVRLTRSRHHIQDRSGRKSMFNEDNGGEGRQMPPFGENR
jgi:hypothetical protein